MTTSELKFNVERHDPDSNFFAHKTMKFFGDTMKNYGVREIIVETWTEKNVPVYELYRKHAVKHGLTDSAYFRKDNFNRTFKKRE